MAKVVVAMSGGVDSSVAAHLLKRAGHEIVGLFMRHGEAAAAGQTGCATNSTGSSSSTGSSTEKTAAAPLFPILSATPAPTPSRKQGCCSVGDAADARRVADRLDVPFYA